MSKQKKTLLATILVPNASKASRKTFYRNEQAVKTMIATILVPNASNA